MEKKQEDYQKEFSEELNDELSTKEDMLKVPTRNRQEYKQKEKNRKNFLAKNENQGRKVTILLFKNF